MSRPYSAPSQYSMINQLLVLALFLGQLLLVIHGVEHGFAEHEHDAESCQLCILASGAISNAPPFKIQLSLGPPSLLAPSPVAVTTVRIWSSAQPRAPPAFSRLAPFYSSFRATCCFACDAENRPPVAQCGLAATPLYLTRES